MLSSGDFTALRSGSATRLGPRPATKQCRIPPARCTPHVSIVWSSAVRSTEDTDHRCSNSAEPAGRLGTDEDCNWAPNRTYTLDNTANNIVERRSTSVPLIHPEGQAVAPSEGIKRKRGRQKGSVPWNRGRTMPEKTKAKISAAQKKRWEDPAFRAHQQIVQRGKPAWNKGQKLSTEVRMKMSAAKRRTVLPRKIRYKMSSSHEGLAHSKETKLLLSEKLSGKPKSEDHKEAIAAGQRRRHAAMNLQAFIRSCQDGAKPHEEAVLASANLGEADENEAEEGVPEAYRVCSGPSAPNMYSSIEAAIGRSRRRSSGDASPNDLIVQEFVGQLREFRDLQQELAPWTENFKETTGRRPRFEDVQNTGIAWLCEKYKEYVLVRQKLLEESGQLRSRLEGSSASAGSAPAPKLNSNSSAAHPVTEGATRLARALGYQRSQSSSEVASSASSPPAANSLSSSTEQQIEASQELKTDLDQQPSLSETVSSELRGNSAGDADISHIESQSVSQSRSEAAKPLDNLKNLAGASPRVKAAMLAAAKYKKFKGT